MLTRFWISWASKSLENVSDPMCHCKDVGACLQTTNQFPGSIKMPTHSLHTAQQALHCHRASLVNSMVHRLLNYFYILAFHARLKAYHWRDWDHRNLLHVWPFKAFHRDGSQVRIYWNQFLSEIWMLAHQPCPVWSIHFIKREEKKLK